MNIHKFIHKIHEVERELSRIEVELQRGNAVPARAFAIEWRDNDMALVALNQMVQSIEQAQHEEDIARLLDSQSEFRFNDW